MKIINPPVHIPESDYVEETEKYVAHVKNVPGVVAVLTFGSSSGPGISDLDVLCVVDDGIEIKQTHCLDNNDKKFRKDIFTHSPWVLPQSLFDHLMYLTYLPNLRVVWSSAPSAFKLQSFEVSKSLIFAHLIDHSEMRIGFYANATKTDTINKRQGMSKIAWLLRAEELCRQIEIILSPESDKTINDARAMHRRWMEGMDFSDKDFLDLFMKSELVNEEIFNKTVEKENQLLGNPSFAATEVSYNMAAKRVICSDRIKTPYVEFQLINILGIKRWYFQTFAPLCYAAHLECYGFKSGYCSIDLDVPHAQELKKRADVVRAHNAFTKEKKILFAPKAYCGIALRPSVRWYVRWFDQLYWLANPSKQDKH